MIMMKLNIRIQRLVMSATPPVNTDTKRKQLTLLTSKLKSIETSVKALEENEHAHWKSIGIKWSK